MSVDNGSGDSQTKQTAIQMRNNSEVEKTVAEFACLTNNTRQTKNVEL